MNGRARKFRFVPAAALAVFVLILGGSAVWLIRSFLNSAPASQKKVVQEIQVIRPPPPPPDLEPPPPPPPEEEVDVPEPEQQPDPTEAPPPGEQLGLDAEGGAGADGFGLAARPGGRDLLGSGGSAYAWYAGLLKNEILDHLQDDDEAHKGNYSVLIRVWVRNDGAIERVKLMQSSGNTTRDRAIEQALNRMQRIAQAPPPGMPQPVSLRIVSRA